MVFYFRLAGLRKHGVEKRTLTLLMVNTATVVIHTVFGLMSLGNVFPQSQLNYLKGKDGSVLKMMTKCQTHTQQSHRMRSRYRGHAGMQPNTTHLCSSVCDGNLVTACESIYCRECNERVVVFFVVLHFVSLADTIYWRRPC